MGTQIGTNLNEPDNNNIGLDIHLKLPRLAQYINIKKTDILDAMTLCEVEVYETECPCEQFGDKCARTCHCSTPCCNSLNGHCPRCKPGWIPPTCETACSKGTYGDNCSGTCSSFCVDGRQCDHITGVCDGGCIPGYDYSMDPQCNKRKYKSSK
ncbi:multiple epidermal growth factor-like domains protein 6 [Mya arenaria]|uniref:multiple epidermal growth factor-like domains protein 6 n=1 Tax=Mya arenaria TaxID=6604 RepID=UPI0022E991C4|nr:multiple epidermal growth factor-like domains protein 6 [Mya arenaria]XP_052791829.1 multiple epidermal growth factor-like domains protein 6 [Mya arenaria]